MKKFFFFALAAVAMLTSCNKDETIASAQLGAIAFDNVFVNNGTRAITPDDPSYNNTALMKDFKVYGFFDENIANMVFDDQVVNVAEGGVCSYNPVQYWAPGHTYYFAAIAPSTCQEGASWSIDKAEAGVYGPGKVTFTSNDTEDLLYCATSVETKDEITEAPEAVKLVFKHLLSKVRFEFVNQFASESYSFEVTDVKIKNYPKTATVDLAEEDWAWDWAGHSNAGIIEFGNVAKMAQNANDYAEYEKLLIPSATGETSTLNVTFDITLYVNGAKVDTYSHDINVDVELLMGNSYNLKATIDASNVGGTEEGSLYPIEFTVSVEEWKEYTNVDALAILNNKNVAAGETYTLPGDAVVEGSLTVAGTLDGANHTIFAQSVPTNNGLIRPEGEATIKNLVIDGNNAVTADGKSIRAFYVNKDGNYVIDNVITKNVTYSFNCGGEAAPTAATLKVTNSTFESWTSYTSSVTATFENVSFVKGATYAMFRPYGTTKMINCTFEEGFTIDLGSLADGKSITFTGCKVGTAALAAEHLTGATGKDVTIN